MAGFVFRFLTSFVCHLCYVFSRRLCMGNEKLRVKKPFEIITVFGPDNSGKTTLIWNVFNKLLADGGEVTYFHLLGNDANDFHAIVVWKGKIIAICSIGDKADEDCKDDGKYIKDGIEVAKEYEAELLLNAVSDFFEENNTDMSKDVCAKMKDKYKRILDDEGIFWGYKKFKIEKRNTVEKIIKQKQEICNSIINAMQK